MSGLECHLCPTAAAVWSVAAAAAAASAAVRCSISAAVLAIITMPSGYSHSCPRFLRGEERGETDSDGEGRRGKKKRKEKRAN